MQRTAEEYEPGVIRTTPEFKYGFPIPLRFLRFEKCFFFKQAILIYILTSNNKNKRKTSYN